MSDAPAPGPAAADRPLAPGATVAGYRLLRRISGDTPVWLARAAGADQTVCVEIARPTDATTRRVRAHSRVRSPHVLALLDLATDADGYVVLVRERTDWTLATLLGSRAHLAPGEGVTVLAPLTAGLAAIHLAGLRHGRLTAGAVLFCSDGRPVIGGLDSLVDAEQADDRADRGLIADYRALGALIAAVTEIVDEPARGEFAAVAAWVDEQLGDQVAESFLSQLECRLFALAPALPVLLVADRGRGVRDVTPSALPAASPLVTVRGSPGRTAFAGSGLSGWFARVLRGRALALCLGIVVLTVTLLAGLTALPNDRPPPSPDPLTSPTRPAPTGAAGHDREADDTGTDGDDVPAAAETLLRLRALCMSERSSGCVSGYAEPGSALADTDSRAIDVGGRGDLLLGDAARSQVELVEAYGDAVLLRVVPANERRQPVLVLAVRTDTGWRLRDLFEPD